MPEYAAFSDDTFVASFTAQNAHEAYDKLGADAGALDLYVKVGNPDDAPTEDAGFPVAIQIIVHPLTDGWRVQVNDYGETIAERLELALAMAVPYMRDVASPDPLAELFRRPSAPGSAPDMGGGGGGD